MYFTIIFCNIRFIFGLGSGNFFLQWNRTIRFDDPILKLNLRLKAGCQKHSVCLLLKSEI